MENGIIKTENKKFLKFIFVYGLVLCFVAVGFAKQEQFMYKYNFNKVKNSDRISERIEYSIKAIKHSRTGAEVKEVMKLLQNRQNSEGNLVRSN